MKIAVILLSGGMDSTTCLAYAKRQGYRLNVLSIDYGQRHRLELENARKIAMDFGVDDHRIVSIDLRTLGGSALTANVEVPKQRSSTEIGTGIPVTYVPARNTILLSIALGYAETIGAFDLFIGANAIDYSGYPDCRPAFLEAFAALAQLGTKSGVEGEGVYQVHAPLLKLSKAEIIQLGIELGVDYSKTLTCYDPDSTGRACGECDACQLRRKGFEQAQIADPTIYQK